MPAMPHEIEGPQQQLELHRNSSGNSSNAVLAAERDPDAPSKGSMAALMQQAPNPAVVTAGKQLCMKDRLELHWHGTTRPSTH